MSKEEFLTKERAIATYFAKLAHTSSEMWNTCWFVVGSSFATMYDVVHGHEELTDKDIEFQDAIHKGIIKSNENSNKGN